MDQSTVTSCTTWSRVFAELAGKRVVHRVVYQDIGGADSSPAPQRGPAVPVRPQRPLLARMPGGAPPSPRLAFPYIRRVDRWELRMPGCVGEWDHCR
jgi:hypothetical protein